jgi:hypothetical protein
MRKNALANALRGTHSDYARYANVKLRTNGHFWLNRYYSCPLDQIHQWTALAYVERNPVRAGMVSQAEDYLWSSAPTRLSGSDASGFLDLGQWRQSYSPERWRDILAATEPHTGIVGRSEGRILNLVDHRALPAQAALLEIARRSPEEALSTVQKFSMPLHHDVRAENIDLKRLGAVLATSYSRELRDFASLLLVENLGPRTLQDACSHCRSGSRRAHPLQRSGAVLVCPRRQGPSPVSGPAEDLR